MTLAAVINKETLEGLSEAIRAEYVEDKKTPGSYIPDITPMNGYEFANTANLLKTVGKERHRAEEAEKLLKGFDGLNADDVRTSLSKYDELKDADPGKQAKEQFEAMKGDLIKAHTSEKDSMQVTVDNAIGQLRSTLVDAAVTKAIATAGGSVELLTPIIKQSVNMRQDGDKFFAEVVDEKGIGRHHGSNGDAMTISQLVEEMKGKEAFQSAFTGTGNSGSGSGSGDSSGKTGSNNGSSGDTKVARGDQKAINNSLEAIAEGTVTLT